MDCTCDFFDKIGKCIDTIQFNVGVTASTDYVAFITTPMGKQYQAEVTSDANGNITIPATLLPDGLLNEYAGLFRFELIQDGCDNVMLNLKKSTDEAATQYPYVYFEVIGGNITKNEIGCQ